eukprot:CAMPEP_0119320414 /NCGR_PEP_ID=MMETSP1333-20130426/52395_1 /TAXON_ID=418940 /ORGANISM="Scyphosphaera apsteinii, Strain RCC1455" /LENGTH=533 /DNA_ID=CAMNT_0007327131 /DNA_START=20 /DNA_END=1621 /DNA_ORIENTATION=-
MMAAMECGVSAAVAKLRAHPSDAAVQRSGCLEVAAIAQCDDESKRAVVDAGGVAAAVAALQQHPSDMKAQLHGFLLLLAVAEGDDACKRAVVDAGGVASFVAAVRAQPRNRKVQLEGCRALLKIAEGDVVCKRAVVNTGVMAATMAALRMHPKDVEVQQSGCYALLQIANGDDMCKRAVVDAGGVSAAVSALRQHPSDVNVQKAGCNVLGTIAAAGGAFRQEVVDAGGMQLLLAKCKAGPVSAEADLKREAERRADAAMTELFAEKTAQKKGKTKQKKRVASATGQPPAQVSQRASIVASRASNKAVVQATSGEVVEEADKALQHAVCVDEERTSSFLMNSLAGLPMPQAMLPSNKITDNAAASSRIKPPQLSASLPADLGAATCGAFEPAIDDIGVEDMPVDKQQQLLEAPVPMVGETISTLTAFSQDDMETPKLQLDNVCSGMKLHPAVEKHPPNKKRELKQHCSGRELDAFGLVHSDVTDLLHRVNLSAGQSQQQNGDKDHRNSSLPTDTSISCGTVHLGKILTAVGGHM